MKKLIAVSLAVSGIVTAIHSAPIVKYRAFFRPCGSSCWDSGYQFFGGGGHQTITNNSGIYYQFNPGDQMSIYIKDKCCGTGQPGVGLLVGDQYEQYSIDNGATWNMVSGSQKFTYVPQDVIGEAYLMGADTNGIVQQYTISPCP